MLSVYRDIMELEGRRVPPSFERDHQVWVWYALAGLLEKFLKHATALLLAQVLDQEELPPNPTWFAESDWRCGPFRGVFGNYLRRVLLMNRRNGLRSARSQRLAFTLYQGKAGSLPVEEEFVANQVEAAIERLTGSKDRPLEAEDEEGFCGDEDKLLRAIDHTVAEVFPIADRQKSDHLIPALKSSYQSSRAKGGAFAAILPAPALGAEVLLGYLSLGSAAVPFYGPDPQMFEDAVEDSLQRARLKKECDCIPVGLLEPFKVRVITRGDADIYHLARRWQRTIHPIMARHPTFNLTRSPIRQHHLDFFSERLQRKEGMFIVSGDYESATDLLDPELSVYCLGKVLQRIGAHVEAPSLTTALTGHLLHKRVGDAGERQTWGQLMGSPVSFPVLCLINAAVTRLAIDLRADPENDGSPRAPLDSYPLLINGDDVGFETDAEGYAIWKEWTMKAGLKFSLGKNYTHRSVLILNSQLYRMHDQVDFFGQVTERLWKEEHLQVGLLWGQVKGVCRESSEQSLFEDSQYLDSAMSVAQMAQTLLDTFPHCPQDLLISRLLLRQRSSLVRVPPGMPWFAPRRLGGVGIPMTRDVAMSKKQLKLCAFMATRSSDDPLTRPLVRPEVPGYLVAYMRAIDKALRGLPRKMTTEEPEKSFKFLPAYAARHGPDPPEVTNLGTVTSAFRRLWRIAQATKLHPMSQSSLWGYRPAFFRQSPRWV
jgi:hypothetical protein